MCVKIRSDKHIQTGVLLFEYAPVCAHSSFESFQTSMLTNKWDEELLRKTPFLNTGIIYAPNKETNNVEHFDKLWLPKIVCDKLFLNCNLLCLMKTAFKLLVSFQYLLSLFMCVHFLVYCSMLAEKLYNIQRCITIKRKPWWMFSLQTIMLKCRLINPYPF